MCTLTHILCSTDDTLKVQYMVWLEARPVGTCSVVMTAQILNGLHKPNLWPENVRCPAVIISTEGHMNTGTFTHFKVAGKLKIGF